MRARCRLFDDGGEHAGSQHDCAPQPQKELAITASARSICFQGLVANRLGIALWQADGSGPEPAAIGHRFVTPIETITAHYYVASRDYIDSSAHAGVTATELRGAWPQTRAALRVAGLAAANLHLRLPLTTAGADREGEDWFYRDGVETRYLQPQAPLRLLLNDETLLEFAPPRLVLTEDYRRARNFAEVRIALMSEPALALIAGGSGKSTAAAALADALSADLARCAVRVVVDAIHLTHETFDGHGRTSGRYAELPTARLEVVGV